MRKNLLIVLLFSLFILGARYSSDVVGFFYVNETLTVQDSTVSPVDKLSLSVTGGVGYLTPVSISDIVVNVNGDDTNVVVEGDTDPQLLWIDAGTDRVGIGTAAPETRLHLADIGSLQVILGADTDDVDETHVPSILFRRDGTTDALLIGVEGEAAQTFTNSTANTPYIESTSTGKDIQFATEGTLAMTITSGQDVSVEDCLIVSNEVKMGTDGSQTDPGFTWTDDDNMGMFRAAEDTLAFTTAGTEAMRIDSTGQVGVGGTTPSITLAVGDSDTGLDYDSAILKILYDNVSKMEIIGSEMRVYERIKISGADDIIFHATDLTFGSGNSTVTKMTLDASGNLIIAAGDITASAGSCVDQYANVRMARPIVDADVPAEPFTCNAAVYAWIIPVDDTNDTGASWLCWCARIDDVGGYAWRKVSDEGSCF